MRAMATKDKRTEQLFSLIRNGAQLNVWDQIELVWRLSLPAIFAQISFVMVQYIDAAMVGHLGANPAASIGLLFLPLARMGTYHIRYSRLYGSSRTKNRRKTIR